MGRGRRLPLNPTVDQVCERFILPFDVNDNGNPTLFTTVNVIYTVAAELQPWLNQSTPIPVLRLSQLTPLLIV